VQIRRRTYWCLLAALAFPAPRPVLAQAAAPAAAGGDAPKTLETVVVSGRMPGPGLWRVARGENALYLLGTIAPLPAKMEWESREVDAILARTDEVLAPAGAEARVGARDAFNIALLARSAYAAIRIPGRQKLADLLPERVFREWRGLQARYLADATGIERSRPIFASQDLYYAAIAASGMTRADIAWQRVAAIAEERDIPVTETRIRFPLDLDRKRYKAGIAALAQSRADETTCFAQTVQSLEADLETMRQGANAWAVGDLERLRSLGHAELKPACRETYDELMGFQQRPGLEAEADAAWFAAAATALERNDVTFAVLPLARLAGPQGMLERLRAAGYDVEEPSDAEASEAAEGGNGPPPEHATL
jgi:hypothetical protein